MNRRTRLEWSVCLALSLLAPACGGEVTGSESAEEAAPTEPDTETANAIALPSQDLATFELPDGGRIRYVGSIEAKELTYIEEHKIGTPRLMSDDQTPLQVYLALAAGDAPVPELLVELDTDTPDKDALLAGRTRVESLEGVVRVPRERLPEAVGGAKAVISSCGSDGASFFEDHHCYYRNNDLIAPNRHDAIWYCDEDYNGGNSVWFSLTRSTDSWRKNSYSETAACGVDVHVEHFFHAGFWYTLDNSDMTVPENDVWYMFRMGGGWYPRRVEHHRTESHGGLRAYSEFTNP